MKYNNNEGLDTTPIGNTEGFRFRKENKDKWISKRGFQIYQIYINFNDFVMNLFEINKCF